MIILNENNTGNLPDENMLKTLQTALNKYCLSLTHSTWDAEDLAQDTWIKALGVLKTSENTNVQALLMRIAKNTWIDVTRRKATFYKVLERIHRKETASSDSSLFEIEHVFQALIQHLSPLQRTVFLMRDVLGYSAIETAERIGTTDGAVKAALFRARQALQSVREELFAEAEGPSPSKDEDFKAFLRALAMSYEKGQLATLLELVLQDETNEVMAMGSVQNIQLSRSIPERSRFQPEIRMAA